jgi:hypothetical protein
VAVGLLEHLLVRVQGALVDVSGRLVAEAEHRPRGLAEIDPEARVQEVLRVEPGWRLELVVRGFTSLIRSARKTRSVFRRWQ